MDNKILANGNNPLPEEDKNKIKQDVAVKFGEILDLLGFDRVNDPNLQDTPNRVAKMFMDELFIGNFSHPPKITTFPNTQKYDEIIISGPIEIKSMCAHHFLPFVGQAWVGYIPGDIICGLSKLARIVHYYMRRPQLQEELTVQVANHIEELLKPKGVIVVMKSEHFCEKLRGVEEHGSQMYTSCVRGYFLQNPSTKQEFFEMIKK